MARQSVPAFAVETELDLGGRSAPLIARVNRRARRLIVKVDPIGGCVLVTAPSRRALPEAIAFARTHARWILARLAEAEGPAPFAPGAEVPFRAEAHWIVLDGPARAPVRRVAGAPALLLVGGAPEHVNRRVVDWLKREAHAALSERVRCYAGLLGRRATRVQLRDGRTRWGSCTKDGVLSFSWRLILAPPAILDYVAAHECAHLVHLDHSRAFWTTVRGLGVDARAARDWFSENGARLHAYGVASVAPTAF